MFTVTYYLVVHDVLPLSGFFYFLYHSFKSPAWIIFKRDERVCRFDFVYFLFFTYNYTYVMTFG